MIPPFPADEILVARGKYSSLTSERRKQMKLLTEDMELITTNALCVIRAWKWPGEDGTSALEALDAIEERMMAARLRVNNVIALESAINELKPVAWSKEKEPVDE